MFMKSWLRSTLTSHQIDVQHNVSDSAKQSHFQYWLEKKTDTLISSRRADFTATQRICCFHKTYLRPSSCKCDFLLSVCTKRLLWKPNNCRLLCKDKTNLFSNSPLVPAPPAADDLGHARARGAFKCDGEKCAPHRQTSSTSAASRLQMEDK